MAFSVKRSNMASIYHLLRAGTADFSIGDLSCCSVCTAGWLGISEWQMVRRGSSVTPVFAWANVPKMEEIPEKSGAIKSLFLRWT